MKILLYLEAENLIKRSGIGRAIRHQEKALQLMNIPYTTDPKDDYDIAHINTYWPKSLLLFYRAKKAGKKVIIHGHSTKEDFRQSFIGSNLLANLFGKYLTFLYKRADFIITPSEYSKQLIQGYGVKTPIVAISNGIDLTHYQKDLQKEAAFRDHFKIKEGQKVVICAGLYFKRKGIEDFVKVAEKMPDVRFIWFGSVNKWLIPRKIRRLVTHNHPQNCEFPGYFKGAIFEGAMSASDAFFFPSYEETEGIVVLEALASHQNVVIRDIPVYQGWIGRDAVEKGDTVDDFVQSLRLFLDSKVTKKEKGYAVAQSRSIDKVAQQLSDAYHKVMELE